MGSRTKPPSGRDVRALLDRPALAGLALVVLVALAVVGVRFFHARPVEVPVPRVSAVVEPSSPGIATSPATSSNATVLVHVAGAVRRPGLVKLPPGARVGDAVEAAGGLRGRADAASVNLARPVADGEQILVLRRTAQGSAATAPALPPPSPAPGAAAGPLNLNTATLEQLDALPGIGPVLAQRILDWRTTHQRFSSVDELGEVSGIGETTLADLRPLVTV